VRRAGFGFLILLVIVHLGLGQSAPDPDLEAQLRQVFPSATSFSARQTGPPAHFIAYDGPAGPDSITGYVFWTTDLEPLERGYDGPIKMLVGVNLDAELTGVLVTHHNEPYGYFSVELPAFARQFLGKDIRDPFRVGDDVDAVSRATITITSASRAIRNGARRLARALMTPPETRQ
jgi:transcriptional regulator of nitric oxide reductase